LQNANYKVNILDLTSSRSAKYATVDPDR
jgi:hypothetical protein